MEPCVIACGFSVILLSPNHAKMGVFLYMATNRKDARAMAHPWVLRILFGFGPTFTPRPPSPFEYKDS